MLTKRASIFSIYFLLAFFSRSTVFHLGELKKIPSKFRNHDLIPEFIDPTFTTATNNDKADNNDGDDEHAEEFYYFHNVLDDDDFAMFPLSAFHLPQKAKNRGYRKATTKLLFFAISLLAIFLRKGI